MTVQYLFTDTISSYLDAARTKSTLASYNAKSQALASLFAFFKSTLNISPNRLHVEDLLLDHIAGYLTHLQETRSVETEHLYVRAIIDYLMITLQTTHPTHHQTIQSLIDYLQAHRRTRPHSVQQAPIDTINELLTGAHSLQLPPTVTPHDRLYFQALRDRAIVFVLADTGLRPSELCDLRATDVHHHTISLKPVTVIMQPQTASYISQYLTARQSANLQSTTAPPLFARHDKRASNMLMPISRWTLANIVSHMAHICLSDATKTELHRSRTSISPITFRHYFVVTTLVETNDLHVTAQRARHHDLATTRQYIPQTTSANTK